MTDAEQIALRSPRTTAGFAPPRKPGSARRTSTIDVSWLDGPWSDMAFAGRARDIVTPRDGGAPRVNADDRFDAVINRGREILAMTTTPRRPSDVELVGHRGGGHLRRALEHIVPEEWRGGTPLYLVLDDISGASLVAAWAWSQWNDDWLHDAEAGFDEEKFAAMMAEKVGICVGFAPGGTAARLGADIPHQAGAPTPDLRNPQDPEGWHAYAVQTGVAFRRARRIDVVRGDGVIEIDAAFQDSATMRSGGRGALHEYTLSATVDPASQRIVTIDAQPRVLPFPECPSATKTLAWLEGAPISELRAIVLERLRGVNGCTHLNDALRALADAPHLIALLESA